MSILDSLYEYESKEVRVPIADDVPELSGHYFVVDSLSHDGFSERLLAVRREILDRENMSEDEQMLMLIFGELKGWSLPDEFNFSNMKRLMNSPVMQPRRKATSRNIDIAASDRSAHFKKKSELSSTGSELSGSLTAEPEKKTPKRAAKR